MLNAKKDWKVNIRQHEGFVVLEILHTSPLGIDDKSGYIEVLRRLLSQYEVVAISQVIDEWQQNVGRRDVYTESLAREYVGNIALSPNYEIHTRSKSMDHTYVIHTLGPLSNLLLERLMCFGVTALPNIVYGLKHRIEHWPEKIIEWDNVVAGWFRFKLEDASLLDLIKEVELLGWTSDEHLTFGVLKGKALDEILSLLLDIAKKNNWNLIANEQQVI